MFNVLHKIVLYILSTCLVFILGFIMQIITKIRKGIMNITLPIMVGHSGFNCILSLVIKMLFCGVKVSG